MNHQLKTGVIMNKGRDVYQVIGIAVILGMLPLSSASAAQDKVEFGVGVINTPRYSGADHNHNRIVPIVNIRVDQMVFNVRDGLGVHYDLNDKLYFEQFFGYQLGRDDNNDDHLRGMGDIDSAWTTHSKLGYWFTPYIELNIAATKALNHSQGVSYGPTLAGRLPLEDNWTIIGSARWLLATEEYTDTFYGINSTQSARTGYQRYHPGGGGYGHQFNAGVIKAITPHFTMNFNMSYTHLSDKVAKSDVVKDENNFTSMLGISYRL